MLDFNQINSLGQILNDTWGTTTLGEFRTPTMSIKATTQGDVLTCQYTTVVNVASERNLRDQCRVFEEESLKKVNEYIKMVKKEFKESTGSALKLKEVGTQDNVELITTSPYAPRKTAYYRRFTNFQVG
jgi:hypothetical protein